MAKNIYVIRRCDVNTEGETLTIEYHATLEGAEKAIHAMYDNFRQNNPQQQGEYYEIDWLKGEADTKGHWSTVRVYKFLLVERCVKTMLHLWVNKIALYD